MELVSIIRDKGRKVMHIHWLQHLARDEGVQVILKKNRYTLGEAAWGAKVVLVAQLWVRNYFKQLLDSKNLQFLLGLH